MPLPLALQESAVRLCTPPAAGEDWPGGLAGQLDEKRLQMDKEDDIRVEVVLAAGIIGKAGVPAHC